MKKILLLVVGVALLFGCKTASSPSGDNVAINKLFNDYYEERLKLFPMEATLAGDHRYNDQLPNMLSDAFHDEAKGFFRKYLAAAKRYDRAALSADDEVSRDILKWECEMSLKQLDFPTHLLPIEQFNGLHLAIGQWAGGTSAQPFKTPQDYENWLKRVDRFIEWSDTAIERMREGVIKGYVLPKALTQKLIPQTEGLAKGPATNHVFYGAVKAMPAAFSAEDRARITKAYTTMIEQKVMPAFQRLDAYLKQEYLPASRDTSGISAIPRGKKYYALQIKIYTTTDMSADEVFDLGQNEVKRLLAEMESVKKQVGFEGDLKAFFAHLRDKKELNPFTDPKQVLENFHAIHRKMESGLDRLFSQKPKTKFEIRRTEAFREATASAEYLQPSIDGTRPGIFYVPIPDVRKYNILSDEDLFLHEAIPGHHYQISLQQENTRLPKFRRTMWYTAYGEGWALYAESLGKELGLYQDPYQYFGMLSAEMHRAIRLVVDVGIHAKGWTREQAIQYSLDHEAETEEGIVAEIERYMAWPGQALAYKVGQLKIRELRAKAEKALGNRFDPREFHRIVLDSGCLPLAILEDQIETWIVPSK